jgi:hypothetical protein
MHQRFIVALVLALTVAGACGGSSDARDSAQPAVARSIPPLDPENVPVELRHLIPLAQQWGIGDDIERLAKGQRATPAERAGLRRAVTPHQTRITQWLDSFGQELMSQEAATFMYMQLAIEEMTGRP